MTVVEFQARRIERIAEAVAHFVRSTRADRLRWRPPAEEGATRSVLDQISECVLVNRYFAELLLGESPEPMYAGDAAQIAFTSADDAADQLVDSARGLAKAIKNLTESDLSRTFQLRRGPAVGETVIEMPYRNMAYHAGQINFIQCLYGDSEFHVPPTWL